MRIQLACCVAALSSAAAYAAESQDPCKALLAEFDDQLADATCVESADLTTNNPATTPRNNSIAGLPALAFTPVTDRGVISPNPPNRTQITKAVPGLQIAARVAGDPTREARFLLRLPDDWNGNLVVVSATPPADPLACRLNPASPVWVHFYDNDAAKPFTEWQERIVQAAKLARDGVKARYQHYPRYTYAVGTSNGGYQVRRAIEEAPDLFDGGVDWEGTFVDPSANNLLGTLPPAIRNFPAYVASGFDANSPAAQAIRAAGYPPDIVKRNAAGAVTASLWQNYSAQFWE